MKKLNVTKEHFEKSKYFTKKYGKLEFVSESGKLFKTEKGNVLKFKESNPDNNLCSGSQGCCGSDLRTMGYEDLDDYWR